MRSKKKKVEPIGDPVFEALCEAHGIPKPVCEYKFNIECPDGDLVAYRKDGKRRAWRFDYLFEDWLAVEKVGAIWIGGHHSGGQDQIDDMEKYNYAALQGYVLLQFTPQQFEDGSAFAFIKRALGLEELVQ